MFKELYRFKHLQNLDMISANTKEGLNITVIGCGITGLSIAWQLSKHYPVRIVSNNNIENTVSAKAGAMWEPVYVSDPRATGAWSRDTWRFLKGLAHNNRFSQGIQQSFFSVTSTDVEPDWAVQAREQDSIFLEEVDYQILPNGGYRFSTYVIDPNKTLSTMMDDFKRARGELVLRKVIRREYRHLSGVLEGSDIVINSTGKGTNELTDHNIFGLRGYLLEFPVPDQKLLEQVNLKESGETKGNLKDKSCYWITSKNPDRIVFGGISQDDKDTSDPLNIAFQIIDNIPDHIVTELQSLYSTLGTLTDFREKLKAMVEKKDATVRYASRPMSSSVQLNSRITSSDQLVIDAGPGLGGAGWSSFVGPMRYAVNKVERYALKRNF